MALPARKSRSQALFEQLRDQIVSGEFLPGAALPSERTLCDRLGVNRGAVREALKRLEQVRLISIQHGGATRVLDFRGHAGLDLLASLLVAANGGIDISVARSVMELRSALAIDIARLAAIRGGSIAAQQLRPLVARMRTEADDLAALQATSLAFWEILVDSADNVAYRLAYNSMRVTYDRIRDAMAPMLAEELRAVDACARLADAIAEGSEPRAERAAREIIRLGELGVLRALDALAAGSTGTSPAD